MRISGSRASVKSPALRHRIDLAGASMRKTKTTKPDTDAEDSYKRFAVPVVIGVLIAPKIEAQNAPANTQKFEVASITSCPDALCADAAVVTGQLFKNF